MKKFFYMGDPKWMGMLTLFLIIMVAWYIYHFIVAYNSKQTNPENLLRRISYGKTIGLFTLIIGVFGQLTGLSAMFSVLEKVYAEGGEVKPELIYGAIKVTMLVTYYGIIIYLLSLLLWLVATLIIEKKFNKEKLTLSTPKKGLLFFLIASTLLSCSQKSSSNENPNNSETKVTVTKTYALMDYQEDFNQMVKLLLKNHPQPYEFIDEDSLNKLIREQYEKITETTTFAKFIWICQEVVAAIKCGHSEVWSHELNNVPKSMVFPMNVKYVGSQLYIIDPKNNSDKLSVGDEILSINGVKAKKLKEEIFRHLSSDGYNESHKHERTNFLFKPFSSMFFDYPTSYKVSVLKNGKEEEIELKEAENLDQTKTFLDNCENQLCFDTNPENNTARITIRSFAYYKKRLPIFKSFVDSCFQHINKNQIQNLIIDLRNNSGGDPFCGSYLLQHIATKPYIYFNKDAKWYRELKKPIRPNPNRFKSKPYILTNGRCFSTTGHFCSIVKENNFGIFIGDTTGGTYTCNDNSKIYTLENTKVLFKVARNTYSTTVSTLTNKHGIIPDHYVIPTIENYLNNTDTVFNFTMKLIVKE